jgi:hypothetical protein
MLLSTIGTSVNSYTGQGVQTVVQAQLAANLNSKTFVLGNTNVVSDTIGTGNWKFYVAGGNSIASITSSSSSAEWSLSYPLSYVKPILIPTNILLYYPFNVADISLSTPTKVGELSTGSYIYSGTLANNASIATNSGSRISGEGYLSLSNSSFTFSQFTMTTSGFTFAFWFRLTDLNPGFSSFITMDGIGSINVYVLGIYLNTHVNDQIIYAGNFLDNAWRHFALTIEYSGASGSSSLYKMYVNGSIQNQGTQNETTMRAVYSVLGLRTNNYLSCDGGFDDLRIYNRPLSQTEVSVLYVDSNPSSLADTATGANWMSKPATPVDSSETSYTVKSNEIALKPGTNSTYAVWTAPKTTNVKVDVSFADYHTRSTGVGFQMFKINADDTFGSTIFPRTVTSAALTNAASTNYLSVPSRTLSVSTGDKIFYRIDANGNTVTASSVLATTIYADSNYVPVPNPTNINEIKVVQAQLATNLNSTTLVSGNANTIYDTTGAGDWKFYVAGNTSVAAITSESASTEWTGGSLLPYVVSPTVPTDMSFCFNFNSNTVSGTTVSDSTGNYTGTLVNGATIGTDGSPGPGGGYLSLTKASGHYFNFPPTSVTALGFTISMWFRATSNNVTFARLFDMWSSSNFSMFINTSPEGIGLQNGGNNRYIYTGTVIDNVWRHITLTIDYAGASGASSVYKCYINGTLQTTTTAAYPVLGLRTSYNLGTVLNFGNGGAESFDGGLDDFRIYHRAITADEVSLIYSQASMYYPFELADISLSTPTKIGDLATGTYVYNGTLVGASATIAVDAGSRVLNKGYLSLIRTNTYFKFAPFSVLNTGLSFSFWGRFAATTIDGGRILDMRDPEISLQRIGGGSFKLYVTGPNDVFNSPIGMFDNVWRHFAVTIAYGGASGATSTYTLYINGSVTTSATKQYPALGARNYYNIGSNSDTNNAYGIDGGIDDFQIYQRALSQTEVSALYAGPLPPALKDTVTGATWISKSAITLDDIDTSYTVKSNEIALKPGTNSTYAIWTAPKTTNIRVDVSFADYHTRSNGVGFQMFKINSDNTFGSTIFSRTVTSAVLTDLNSSNLANYLTVPSTSLSVVTGDKVVYRIDANGNTTAASSVLATNIYSYSGIWN